MFMHIHLFNVSVAGFGHFVLSRRPSRKTREHEKTRGIGSARLRAQTVKLEKSVAGDPQKRKDEKTREIGFATTGRSKSLLRRASEAILHPKSLLECAFDVTWRTKSLLGDASRAFLMSLSLLKGFEITARPCSVATVRPKSLGPCSCASLKQENYRNGFRWPRSNTIQSEKPRRRALEITC